MVAAHWICCLDCEPGCADCPQITEVFIDVTWRIGLNDNFPNFCEQSGNESYRYTGILRSTNDSPWEHLGVTQSPTWCYWDNRSEIGGTWCAGGCPNTPEQGSPYFLITWEQHDEFPGMTLRYAIENPFNKNNLRMAFGGQISRDGGCPVDQVGGSEFGNTHSSPCDEFPGGTTGVSSIQIHEILPL